MKITKKSITMIIISIAAVALIIAAVIFIPKILNRKSPEQIAEDMAVNATVIKCNAEKTLTDADFKDVEELVKGIVGDKFKSVDKEKGFAPTLNLENHGYSEDDISNMSEEEYEKTITDMIGDRLILTCLLLTEEERYAVYTAVAVHFDFDHESGADVNYPDMNDIFRQNIND